MSQEKVDRYKEEKAHRQQIIRRKKIVTRLEISAIVIVLVGLVTWFSMAVYQNVKAEAEANAETVTTTLYLSDIEDYLTEASEAADEIAAEDETAEDETAAEEETTEDETTESEDTEAVVSSSSAE